MNELAFDLAVAAAAFVAGALGALIGPGGGIIITPVGACGEGFPLSAFDRRASEKSPALLVAESAGFF